MQRTLARCRTLVEKGKEGATHGNIMALIESWVLILAFLSPIQASSDESRLLNDLLKTYQSNERPVMVESEPLPLVFGVSLQQIIDLDERNQLLKSNLWLEYTWHDINLSWNEVTILLF